MCVIICNAADEVLCAISYVFLSRMLFCYYKNAINFSLQSSIIYINFKHEQAKNFSFKNQIIIIKKGKVIAHVTNIINNNNAPGRLNLLRARH